MRAALSALKSKWSTYVSELNTEFYSHVGELLEHDAVMRLDDFIHHHAVTRLRHSLDVAYTSFVLAKLLRCDSRSAAMSGLLHDLYFYDTHATEPSEDCRRHISQHPKIALENARCICELNKVEENIIRRHMWLITLVPPKYKEGFIVTAMDKFCALREFSVSLFSHHRPPLAVTANHL